MFKKLKTKKIWKDTFKIHSYESDFTGQATLPNLCHLMQESAWNHAENLQVGFSHLLKKNLIWVLSRQLVMIYQYPKWGDIIQVHTWPTGKDRLFCYRDFKIFDENNNIIGLASTTWFVIDLAERKPQRTDSYIQLDVDNSVERVFPSFPAKIHPVKAPEFSRTLQVNYSDLDVNDHVNNVKYIEFVLDSLPLEFLKTHLLKGVEVNYIAEAKYSDNILIHHETKNNGSLEMLHDLFRKDDNLEICRARTVWENKA